MWGGMMQTLQNEGPDPQLLADAVAGVIDAPAGQRPLRTVCDPWMGGEGPQAINDLTDTIQAGLLGHLGLAAEAEG
jgi:hypothetical protein